MGLILESKINLDRDLESREHREAKKKQLEGRQGVRGFIFRAYWAPSWGGFEVSWGGFSDDFLIFFGYNFAKAFL